MAERVLRKNQVQKYTQLIASSGLRCSWDAVSIVLGDNAREDITCATIYMQEGSQPVESLLAREVVSVERHRNNKPNKQTCVRVCRKAFFTSMLKRNTPMHAMRWERFSHYKDHDLRSRDSISQLILTVN
jgi:hypothetical protein